MIVKGHVHKYGDNVDTDVIMPGAYLSIADPKELAKHCMEGIDPDFSKKIAPSDIIVGGENFGCGSSREHAPQGIKGSGISCVIAKSFARIFYRNSINIGLPILECAEAAEQIKAGDEVEINFETGVINDITQGKKFQAEAFPAFIQEIIDKGGLIDSISAEL